MRSKDQKPFVSICCHTYNQERYIAQAIESFLMQDTTFPFEIVIGEDCSTDRTSKICIAYQKRNPNIIKLIINEQNQGAYKNFRNTLNACRGEYIALCEGDDYWTVPYKIQKQVDFLEANPDYDICCTYSNKVDENGNIIETINDIKKLKYNQYDFLTNNKYQTRTATTLFRKKLLKEKDLFKYKNYSGDTWLRIIATKNNDLIVLPFVSAVYRIHSNGIWSSLSETDKNKKASHDWKMKFKYALRNNLKALPKVLYYLFKTNIKWRILLLKYVIKQNNLSYKTKC